MTPKERAAMQQALKAMKDASPYGLTFKEAITALLEVLERPVSQEQNSMFMEGYRIGLAEMREKCATVSEQGTGEAVQKAALELLLNERKRIAAAIRAIKFEGDTGFRPVSEMVEEHKQDPKKAAAIEKAKMRKTTRAEKIAMSGVYEVPVEQAEQEPVGVVEGNGEWGIASVLVAGVPIGTKLYAAPVRTKDLTDDELQPFLDEWWNLPCDTAHDVKKIFRAVIAADREKQK